MNSKQILSEIENKLKELEHKSYCKISFQAGYLIGRMKSIKEKK